ncbi:hypothetical protein EDB92DRAFT_1849281 [Lactarius akahatsu]|uniref:Uncharacterized protein n=1 Tax=Lactarius akahatsu TaxID=416441 RepID=A0AAD4QF06_9AGAM|nr:hypothetical protein EDB92DRAFT_1849281 [Lactarius akahatsu]
MLALSRSTGVKGISRHARALSTIASSASSPDAGAEQSDDIPLTNVEKRRRRLASSSAECMFVYPWDEIRSSAEGLAIAHAIQEKYGPAREVIFPRDIACVTVFQPYFWLVFDNADVRKRHPEESAKLHVHVPDLPEGDGHVGVEEMLRALGLSTGKGEPPEPQPSAEDEGFADAADAADGYKTVEVRVEWARVGPGEVLQRRFPLYKSLPDKALIPEFAASWLAFDGFSPEAARGPHTPNLFRAREKWRALAGPTTPDTNATETTSSGDERASELEAGANVNVTPIATSREWTPIIPLSHSLTPPRPTTVPESDADIHTTDDLAPIAAAATAAATPATPDPVTVAPTFAPSSTEPVSTENPVGPKMSRRERILHLARQNSQTPFPELAEKPQPAVEAEKSEEESDQEGKKRTIRERLWRLVGGNY